ncbi:MAG TPA: LptF/LptG family permease [Tepidisphaeraceae bacterium]|jgi:lipopolysaccharide export LptBFGC system permease protein LptF
MSKTLFWYLLKDLLRIFMLAAGTLAGIMSFGALLRPLTQHGLDASQIGKILSYFQPAMMTYSLPIAALFATTIVYGRLSADNELTACRASGISSLAMTAPAFLLGLVVALISLSFLSFIVPVFTLKVEKVIYSNIAQLVANKITRTHEISYGRTSIFAQAAEVKPPVDGKQVVDLISPMIFTYATVDAPEPEEGAPRVSASNNKDDKSNKMKVPSKIWIARRATAYITQKENTVLLEAVLADGANFPRELGGSQISVTQAQFGPVDMGTPIRENTKFMDVAQLKQLLGNPESSRRLQATVQQFIRDDQREVYFAQITKSLRDPALRSFRLSAETETLILSGSDLEIRSRGGELVINPRSEQQAQFVRIDHESNGDIVARDKARQVRITLDPVEPTGVEAPRRMTAHVRGFDVIVETDEAPAAHETYVRSINLPMPDDLQAIEHNDVRHYLTSHNASKREQEELKYNFNKLISSIRSEMHARASFAVSCFILVMVGCALGMISRSGNFLQAFAVSVVPALLCIALIVTGQHVCENTPKSMGLGLSLIWSGNVIVLVMAAFLLGKLQRQ